jgi:superfamily I DNA/RNA helicase
MTFSLPEIADDDVAWVCRVLRLPTTAFSGPDGKDPRLAVLRSSEALDVEACPGSGKTTLLVAKLALLARGWTQRQKGVCVLSHTNAARREIEGRLGNTAEGRRLLSYPHFIGTIHSFVNEFLAVPWLRSLGRPVEMIDDDACLSWRWHRLPNWVRDAASTVEQTEQMLRYRDAAVDLGDIRWGKGILGKDTKPYKEMQRVCAASIRTGFHCHDEMFVWGRDLLDRVPDVAKYLRHRFPLLFIDEVQDSSEMQSALLHRIFMDGDNAVRRQRFGDANQAIYQYAGQDGAVTDPFPTPAIRRDVPNSFRFGQSIADLSDPLAVKPQGLKGQGGFGPDGEPDMTGRHAIFLFDDEIVEKVLEAYATYLLDEFSENELRKGSFTAIGGVHRSDKTDHVPRFIGHYWPAYDARIAGTDPQPATFVQYLMAGRRLAEASGEAHSLVEKLAQGILKLARVANSEAKLSGRKRQHRHVLELLEDRVQEKESYLEFIRRFAVEREAVTKDAWEEEWGPAVAAIACAVAGIEALPNEVQAFLAWSDSEEADGAGAQHAPSDNIFRYPATQPQVAIRVGSIHSVKGETHTATLVMETYFKAHHLKTLKRWLLGKKSGGDGESDATQKRLRLHYVGMTRPARLLCLAMREDVFKEAEIAKLRERSWRIGRVTNTGTEWA